MNQPFALKPVAQLIAEGFVQVTDAQGVAYWVKPFPVR